MKSKVKGKATFNYTVKKNGEKPKSKTVKKG